MRLALPNREPVDYQVARDNHQWNDHMLRVSVTASLLSWLRPVTVMDPACGDASVVRAAHGMRSINAAFLSDISKPNFYRVGVEFRPELPAELRVDCLSIEDALRDPGVFDAVVLTEILEHVEDPVAILKMARERATWVVASSPLYLDDSILDPNPEHLWQFDAVGYEEMLTEAGWTPSVFMPVHLSEYVYDFQIWAAK